MTASLVMETKPLRQRLPASALRRRQVSAAVLLYFVLLSIGTVFAGTFIMAFLASLKVNALERPFRLLFDQVNPFAWVAAADLGRQGAGDTWWGGFGPQGRVSFDVTYTAPPGAVMETPSAEVPRRRRGSAAANILIKHFAVDYADIHLTGSKDGELSVTNAAGNAEVWPTRTFIYNIEYKANGPETPTVENLPFNLSAPTTQIVVSSSLSPSRIEQRGRLASWDNITPGAFGLIFNNYRRLSAETADLETGRSLFGSWLLNSFLISFGRMVLTIVVGSLAGYALARLKFKGAKLLFGTMLFSMTIPAQVTFVSNYLVLRDFSLLNTPWAVIVVVVVSGNVLLMKQFFENFPRELEEAALIDGASRFQIFLKIVIPNAKPALIINGIFAFQGAWNDFFWPLILITSPPSALTVQVGLLSLRRTYGSGQADWSLVLAGAFISTVPILLMFILFQRYIIDNQVNVGIK